MQEDTVEVRDPVPVTGDAGLLPHSIRRPVQAVMDADAGVLRSADSLDDATARLRDLAVDGDASPSTEDWETTNIHQIASVLVRHARAREETRGSHWREDFPDRDDDRWRVRLVTYVGEDGALSTREEQVVGEME
jgi:L-aspartate oxidase